MVLECTNQSLKRIEDFGIGTSRGDMEQTAKEALNSESRASQMCALGRSCNATCDMFLVGLCSMNAGYAHPTPKQWMDNL
jgi:hypothetical protein